MSVTVCGRANLARRQQVENLAENQSSRMNILLPRWGDAGSVSLWTTYRDVVWCLRLAQVYRCL